MRSYLPKLGVKVIGTSSRNVEILWQVSDNWLYITVIQHLSGLQFDYMLLMTWCRLEEAEDRYRNREPRDEDLAMIDQLKGAIHRLEASVKQFAVSLLYFNYFLINVISFTLW